jgi:hypothetical protein
VLLRWLPRKYEQRANGMAGTNTYSFSSRPTQNGGCPSQKPTHRLSSTKLTDGTGAWWGH